MPWKICLQKNKRNSFKVYQCPVIKVPMVFGFRNPSILLPEEVGLDNQQLYFILYHEMMHHFNHDLYIQMIIELLSILYWWNPACRVLKNRYIFCWRCAWMMRLLIKIRKKRLLILNVCFIWLRIIQKIYLYRNIWWCDEVKIV